MCTEENFKERGKIILWKFKIEKSTKSFIFRNDKTLFAGAS